MAFQHLLTLRRHIVAFIRGQFTKLCKTCGRIHLRLHGIYGDFMKYIRRVITNFHAIIYGFKRNICGAMEQRVTINAFSILQFFCLNCKNDERFNIFFIDG